MNKRKLQHNISLPFPVKNNQLIVGDVTIRELAERYGTPFYAYDAHVIDQRIKSLRKQLPDDIRIHYAIKANPMPALVRHMAGLVDGFDLASTGEMEIALQTSMPVEHISFAGPGKTSSELARALQANIILHVESAAELQRLTGIAEKQGIRPRVAIRINPDFELKASGMKMGGGPQQFGIDAEQVPDMLRQLAARDIEFMGFHIFSGSQNLRAEAIIETQNKTLDLAMRLSDQAPSPVRLLNIGGGFGIPYFPGESSLDLAPIGANLAKQLPRVRQQLPEVEVILELGRYLVGEAGIYTCEVIERKISRGHTFLITNGGLHHHLAASGNFGQVIRKNYPIIIGNKMQDGQTETVTITGPLCTPLDILGSSMELPRADTGDLVVVLQSGAYGLTASPINFLSHPPPEEIFLAGH